MNTRERMLVSSMILVVLYGGYTLAMQLVRRTPAEVGASDPIIEDTLLTSLRARVKHVPLQAAERQVLHLATTPWEARPFGNTPDWADTTEPVVRDYRYTGYCQVGERRLAIVNGRDYLIGDSIAGTGYTVKSIETAEIRLEHSETSEVLTIQLEQSATKGEMP